MTTKAEQVNLVCRNDCRPTGFAARLLVSHTAGKPSVTLDTGVVPINNRSYVIAVAITGGQKYERECSGKEK
jgi:hypothetical protein